MVRIHPPQLGSVRCRWEHMFVPWYTRTEAQAAVAQASSHADVLRKLDLCPTGGNTALLKRWLTRWQISTSHSEPRAARTPSRTAKPLAEILVAGSSYARANLKSRLYAEGLKRP